MNTKELYEIGERPPLGYVPDKMWAWTIRTERLGKPIHSFQKEVVEVPKLSKDEVLVYNMAAGFNYNDIWAALGEPQNVLELQGKYDKVNTDFHIAGSESSGIVYAVGEEVTNVKIGDEVFIVGIQYDKNCPIFKEYNDPTLSPSLRIWGYEANWGAFAQFSKVQEIQCFPKLKNLSWVEAASISATGGTAYKMLKGWKGNEIKEGDIVLIWGGCGGLGSIAIQLVNYFKAIPIAVVSSEEKAKKCMELGAKGCIDRRKYNHWGNLDQYYNEPGGDKKWMKQAVKFLCEIYKIAGVRNKPKIVFEHVGADTLPTSLFVCDNRGMVVLCGATTGYMATIDLRYLWLGQKRIQGSHAGSREDMLQLNEILKTGKVKPYVSEAVEFDQLAETHQHMYLNDHSLGKKVVKIGLL